MSSSANIGIGSLRWNSTSNREDLFPQIQNVTPSCFLGRELSVPSDLPSVGSNTRDDAENYGRNPAVQNTVAPPHLRDHSILPITHSKLSGHPPPQIHNLVASVNGRQANSTMVDKTPLNHANHNAFPPLTPEGSNVSMKASAWDDSVHSQQRRSSSQNNQNAPNAPSTIPEQPTHVPAHPAYGTRLAEVSFLSYLNNKIAATIEAKTKRVGENAGSAARVCANRVSRHTTFGFPSAENDNAFKSYISEKIKFPATDSKKYISTSSRKSLNSPAVEPEQYENSSADKPTFQILNSGSSEEPDLIYDEVDPKAAYGREKSAKTGKIVKLDNIEATVDALVAPGFEPLTSSYNFEDKVSDLGIDMEAKENVRANQGQDPKKNFLDWDGKTWQPAPADWENDRSRFDGAGFMPAYIRQDWEPIVPRGPDVAVNTKDPRFANALPVMEGNSFMQFEHPLTAPDIAKSEYPDKQRFQTSVSEMKKFAKNYENQVKATEIKIRAHVMQARDSELQIQSRPEEEHPYRPKLDVYLRPATENDANGIAEIYNYYVINSLATEDQAPVSMKNFAYVIDFTRREKLPFVVAIKGKMPVPPRGAASRNAALPQFEHIIGFGYAESFSYGVGGGREGRSRYTAYLHFFVCPNHTKLKVGQSILDRVIQSLSHSYGAKDGYDWFNPTNDPVYLYGGIQKIHQLIVKYAIQRKNDPNYKWMKKFLERYYFDEDGRMPRIARSHAKTGPGPAKFCDVVFFCKELTPESNFGAMI